MTSSNLPDPDIFTFDIRPHFAIFVLRAHLHAVSVALDRPLIVLGVVKVLLPAGQYGGLRMEILKVEIIKFVMQKNDSS